MLDTTTEAGARAEERLQAESIVWLTTVRSDGQSQSVPVWFLWDGETFLICTNPRIDLHLNSSARGGEVVRVEGTAEVVEDTPQADEVGEYVEKYRESITRIGFDPAGFALTYSVALLVKLDRWHVW
jgi:PPOX class probable F420-dependent enzyme